MYKVNFELSNFTNCFYGRRSNFIKLVKGLYPRRRCIPASLRNGAAQLIILENNQGQKSLHANLRCRCFKKNARTLRLLFFVRV